MNRCQLALVMQVLRGCQHPYCPMVEDGLPFGQKRMLDI